MALRKAELRSWAKARGRELGEDRSPQVIDRLVPLIEELHPERILLYSPLPPEPDPSALVERYPARYYLPRVVGAQLAVYPLESPQVRHPWGFLEPAGGEALDPQALDVVLVPGLLFDLKGYRLGRGGGYYDRFLAGLRALRIGLLFSPFLVPELPRDPWDLPMQILVSDEGIHWPERA